MNKVIGVVGLGYVGLPLAVEFSKKGLKVVGYDTNKKRLEQLEKKQDVTLEVSSEELKSIKTLTYTFDTDDLKQCDFYIITVPTPITKYKSPDLSFLISASKMVGSVIDKGNIVVYESTVYPGCTEEICVPLLEKESKLKFNRDFFCGYSPERINPGDKKYKINNIVKITSGSTPEVGEIIDTVYNKIIDVGTYKVSSIKVAEAAKVIENSQRDLNIAFVNELAVIFNKIGICTNEVLKAAGTKWNFLSFKPGLVGGHCIGVDPYYLTYKAESLGYKPNVILSGRSINDNMGNYVAQRVIKSMIKNKRTNLNFNVCILGIAFKENCRDIRNTKVIDVKNELEEFGANVDVFDDNVDKKEVKEIYNIELVSFVDVNKYDGLIIAVAHDSFRKIDFTPFYKKKITIFDVKSFLNFNSDYIERL